MARPVVGIIGNFHLIGDDYRVQATGMINIEAISKVTDALPLMVPADPHFVDLETLMDTCDGFVFTGGRPNVHPSYYGEEVTEAHGEFDQCRDELVLGLIRASVDRGQPVLGICRGFQEFNVAYGGTLYPEIRDLPGRMNHRMPPDGTIEEKLGLQVMTLTPEIARQLGAGEDATGLVIGAVDQNADAARKGLRRGDIILSANYRSTATIAELEAIIDEAESTGREAVLLRVQRRGGSPSYIAVRLR